MGRTATWGDGFVDDGWVQVAAVDRWDRVHPDEVLRLFPALAGTPERLAVVTSRLEQAIAIRWRRLHGRSGRQAHCLQSLEQSALTALADVHDRIWFPRPGRLQAAADRLRGTGPGVLAAAAGEAAALHMLDDLLVALQSGQVMPYAEHRALSLAFYAGVHPGYLWSEALAQHECATAIGWLGVVARGRDALLPSDIAATLADSIVGSDETAGRPRDQRFALCGLAPMQWGVIGRAAQRRLEGHRDVVRLKHGSYRIGWKSTARGVATRPASESVASF